MKKIILIILVYSLIPYIGYSQEVSTLSSELQEALDTARTEAGIIGVSAAVITPDEGLWLGASGLSDKNPPEPIQPEMLFCIGSMTKHIIATLVLQLEEEGILGLDDTVGDWLPDLPEKSARWIDDTITIRQLLDHTSGIYNIFDIGSMWYAVSWFLAPRKIMKPEDTLRFVKRPYFAPGEGFHYSNTNYILLGMIIEKATNSNVAVELRNRFFDPLGLEKIFLDIEEPVTGEFAHGHMLGIDQTRFPREARYSSGWTSAAMFSTAEDMALWAQALFGGRVLSEDSFEQMFNFNDTGFSLWDDEVRMGIGIMSVDHPQFGEIWFFSGNFEGYVSYMFYLSEYDIVVVILINQHLPDDSLLIESLLEAAVN